MRSVWQIAMALSIRMKKDEEVDLNGASKDLRSIKKAVITLGSVYKSGAESSANMFGSFTLTLTLKAGENAVKAIEIPVTVEEPAFGDLYEQNEYAAWADNTYTTAFSEGCWKQTFYFS